MRLLDFGDPLEEMLDFSVEQSSQEFAPIGAEWGRVNASGGARRSLSWVRRIEHASHEAAAAWCIFHPASLPHFRPGKLRVSVQSGQVWDLFDAVLLGAVTRLRLSGKFTTMTSYSATAGKTLPVSGLHHFAGIQTAWILTAHQDQTRLHSAM